jgi:hypothetical protein
MGNPDGCCLTRRLDYGIPARPEALDPRFFKEAIMKKRYTKCVHEGKYVAEVDVELIYTDEAWSPYLSIEDAYKLDDVRKALRNGDIKTATHMAKVFSLTPIAV